MAMIYLLSLIIILTIILGYVRKSGFTLCPICIATVLTWGIGLVGLLFKWFDLDPTLIALLMAISLGAFIDKYGGRFGVVWKTLIVLAGLPAVYWISQQEIMKAVYMGIGIGLITFLYYVFGKEKNINDKFRECC
jgi:hypothetical protein